MDRYFVLKEFHPAQILPVRILQPTLYRIVITQIVGVFEIMQCHQVKPRDDEALLTEAITSLALQYGRYGYRRITALLRNDG